MHVIELRPAGIGPRHSDIVVPSPPQCGSQKQSWPTADGRFSLESPHQRGDLQSFYSLHDQRMKMIRHQDVAQTDDVRLRTTLLEYVQHPATRLRINEPSATFTRHGRNEVNRIRKRQSCVSLKHRVQDSGWVTRAQLINFEKIPGANPPRRRKSARAPISPERVSTAIPSAASHTTRALPARISPPAGAG